jgi:cytochrome c2
MCTYHKIKMKVRKHFVLLATLLLFITSINTQLQAQEGKDMFAVCAACHTIGGGRLIGPDLAEVTERRDEAWLIKFIQNSQEMIQSGDEDAVALFAEYNNIPMPPNNLTDDEVRTLLSYIKNFDASAETKTEAAPVEESHSATESYTEPTYLRKANARNYGTTFFIALILFILALADLIVTRFIKAKFVHVILILITVFIMGEIVVIEAQGLGRQQYYEPEQPIAFSHKVHAGQNKIDCMYCHTTANESMHAGIPSTQLCMNCHSVVKSGKTTGTEEIAKIYASLESQTPIEWIKVHNLPDHVFFSHAQHVEVGQLDCNECHGPIETMDRVMQVNDLSMGWCIDCHRTKEVQFTNNFYKDYAKLHEEINAGKRSKVTVDQIGGDDCQKCHY